MMLSKYFSLKELTYLKQRDTFHTPTEEELANLTRLALVMDSVRELVGRPIIVHCGIRPSDYNKQIGGAKNSKHILGLAIDFHVANIDCDDVRDLLLPKLEELGLRMEDNPGSNWVHIDLGEPKPNRLFKP